MKQALHIKNLTKKYKDFTLDHISLDLPYGMILGLIGENGSGKSTLINSILNIVKGWSNISCCSKSFRNE